jgi:hypothetical protein
VSSFRESISAFGPHKHKIAVSTASAAAIACAVFGSTVGQTPSAHAAASGKTAPVSQPLAAKPAAAPTSAPATNSAPASAAAAAMRAQRAAPELRRAVATTAPAAPQTTAAVKAAPAPRKPDPYSGQSAYQIARQIVPAGQFAAFSWIITRESGWDVTATNPSSGAYGLGQALPASKMAAYGPDYLTNPATQIKWALAYMNGRYGSPNAAQAFWESHGWY